MSYIGKEPQTGAYSMLDALTASATASYSLTLDSVAFVPESANHLLVSLNGSIQKAGSSYTVSGSTLTFSSALTSSDSIDFVLALGNVLDIGTPSDATVTNAKTNFVSTSSAAGLQIKGDNTTGGTLQLNCEQNSHGIKLRSPAHSAGQSYTLTFPTGNVTADKFLKVASVSGSGTTGIGQLSFADAGGGAWTLLSNTDLSSGVAEFNQSSFFTTYSSYKHFMIDLQLVTPDDGPADLRFTFQDGSGTVAGTIRAAWKANRGNASDEDGGHNQTAAANGIQIFGSSRSTNGSGMNGIIEMWQPIGGSTGDINMQWRLCGVQAGYYLFSTGGGMSESGANATGFLIDRASGNLTAAVSSSYMKIYGLAAS